MPAYNISPNATLAERAVCYFHEVNELYDGTLHSICAYAFSTIALDMINNEVFSYTKAMQQPDALQFVEATDKEIDDHQSRGTGILLDKARSTPGQKQFRQSGVSSGNIIPIELLTSTRLGYALTAACSNGASHTGRLTPLSSICSPFAFSSPSVAFMAWNPNPLILFWRFLRLILMLIFG
jgi:hypothetical protein